MSPLERFGCVPRLTLGPNSQGQHQVNIDTGNCVAVQRRDTPFPMCRVQLPRRLSGSVYEVAFLE